MPGHEESAHVTAIRQVATELNSLLDELWDNVSQLEAILTRPSSEGGHAPVTEVAGP
jgi:hypothetical protein